MPWIVDKSESEAKERVGVGHIRAVEEAEVKLDAVLRHDIYGNSHSEDPARDLTQPDVPTVHRVNTRLEPSWDRRANRVEQGRSDDRFRDPDQSTRRNPAVKAKVALSKLDLSGRGEPT